MIKKFFLIFIVLILSSCDYSPLYSSKNNKFLNIEITNYTGDSRANSIIRSRINNNKNLNVDPIKIQINTEYIKKDLSRNTAGDIETYELILISKFLVDFGDQSKTISISKNSKMENFSDKFEEKDYEDRMKENMSNSIYESLILQLINK